MSNNPFVPKKIEFEAHFSTDAQMVELTNTETGEKRQVEFDRFHKEYEERKPFTWPGKLNIDGGPQGHWNGCRAEYISTHSSHAVADAINEWAENHPTALIVTTHFYEYGVLLIYTYVTDSEDRAQIKNFGELAQKLMNRRRQRQAKRAETAYEVAKKKYDEARKKANEELAQLKEDAQLGKLCKQNHKKDKAKK